MLVEEFGGIFPGAPPLTYDLLYVRIETLVVRIKDKEHDFRLGLIAVLR